jgi:hypothetical protein
MTWPKADKVRAGDRVRLRIHWKREPNRVFVDSYRGVQDNGKPAGEGASVGWHKEPVRRNGDVVAWDIVFRLRAVREHYVKVLAKYPEIVVWNVHVHAVEEL